MKILNKIEYLVGKNINITKNSQKPYDDLICRFVSDFSEYLNSLSAVNKYPDLKTLSFWCRKKNIQNLKDKFYKNNNILRVGVGLVFHITPSNIPTNFAYSLLFGLLNGNSNIIKVPSKLFPQIDIICNCLENLLKKKKYLKIKKMIQVTRYSDNDTFTKTISSICDARLIWGGNKSINDIRNFKLNERALDIAFSDRFSLCVIDAKKLLKLDKYEIERLIERFYNDTYLVDQNACSSPHLIIWLNDKSKKIRNIFWKILNTQILKKYKQPEIASIEKYNQLCENILNLKNMKKYKIFNNLLYVITLGRLNEMTGNLRGKWGFFYEYECSSLNKIKNFINKDFQTLTYFGLSKNSLVKFVLQNNLKGIDRIVPIGQALDINLNWDGYDLNKTLTRVVDIK